MNTQQVARAGELYVAAEIHKRGGYAVTFASNMPGIDRIGDHGRARGRHARLGLQQLAAQAAASASLWTDD